MRIKIIIFILILVIIHAFSYLCYQGMDERVSENTYKIKDLYEKFETLKIK